jgi:short-subunit dehydrogenase
VAGDRGRQSNYIYGSAKGALSLFLQGLRNRLAKAGVHVMTVKPGFVDTKMTFGKPGMFLVAQPEQVATEVFKAFQKQRNVVYVPWFWFWIMAIIRAIPEALFKTLKL